MRKRLKSCILIASIIGSAVFANGCVEKITLSEEDRVLVVEGAVNAVLNHDKNYIVKMKDRVVEKETTTWVSDDGEISAGESEKETTKSQKPGDSSQNHADTETHAGSQTGSSVDDAFGVKGFKIKSSGYEVCDSYPGNVEGFSMVATKGNKLIVMKFKVKNISGKSSVLDMLGSENRYRCIINGSYAATAQVTALTDGLNTWSDSILAGKSKDMVLVFQTSEKIASDINSIALSVERDGGTYTASITE